MLKRKTTWLRRSGAAAAVLLLAAACVPLSAQTPGAPITGPAIPSKTNGKQPAAKSGGSPKGDASSNKSSSGSRRISAARKKNAGPARRPPVKRPVHRAAKPVTSKSAVAKKTGPRGQQHPTPERYKEIESALAKQGYLSEEPNGRWSQASVDALKKFQAEHNLQPTGKLDALSLIALGLGPKE